MSRKIVVLLAAAAIAALVQSGRPLVSQCEGSSAAATDEMVVVSDAVSPRVA